MQKMKPLILLLLIIRYKVSSMCLFPPEMAGDFIIQNALVNSEIMQYSTINIASDRITPYGTCFSRNESNVIVVLSPEENACFRCFSLQMVSKNIILLIHTEADINSKCSSSAETAMLKCPKELSLLNDERKFESEFHSIILYRTAEREAPRGNEFCPFEFFDGEIKFDYFLNDKKLCGGYESTLSQCPSGSSLNIRFKGCNKDLPRSANFECIGHWDALNKHYLAVIDWTNETKPVYKCGTYNYDNKDQTEITLKINSDCSSLSSKNEFEMNRKNQQIFKIQKHQMSKVISEVDFPSWLQGPWQHITVLKNQLVFRDQSSFKSYRMKLVNQFSDDKFIVLSRSQCGEESFKCLWIRKLDANIIEFQTSSEYVEKLTNFMLCNDEHFDNSRWLTFSKVGRDVLKTPCPIDGKYTGILPDDSELCSVMSSTCNSDIMYFQIGPCNAPEIYEKRIYRCLGQWTDKNSSTVYTFTKRVDDVVSALDTYECFVGLMTSSVKQIILREAGENCYKSIDPQHYGMEMNQIETCLSDTSSDEVIVKPTQKDPTLTYETVFDDGNNNIDFNLASSTRKPKPTKNHDDRLKDDEIEENDIAYEPKSRSSSSNMIHGVLLMILSFQGMMRLIRNI